ncbi:unnamed protein product [Microthlaspi erraticum]|uniref:Uncharacterized protein n=1 Tax=Microthlaspi erraticum TaxID=1685480 RepID=A0A6D2JCD4_9BRAS|nr:unnamed protein product [Microthlaspi erraticum]
MCRHAKEWLYISVQRCMIETEMFISRTDWYIWNLNFLGIKFPVIVFFNFSPYISVTVASSFFCFTLPFLLRALEESSSPRLLQHAGSENRCEVNPGLQR